MAYVNAPPQIERTGVIAGFILSIGSGLTPEITLGVLFAQDTMYRPTEAPSLSAAPASQQSWLFYNSSSGFYWHSSVTPVTAGDAFVGWVVTGSSSVLVVSGQVVAVPDPDENVTAVPLDLGSIMDAGSGSAAPGKISNLQIDDPVDYSDPNVARITGQADLPSPFNSFDGCEVFITISGGSPIPVGHQHHNSADTTGPYTFELKVPRPYVNLTWRIWFASRNATVSADLVVAAGDDQTPYVDVAVTKRPQSEFATPPDVQSIVLCPLAEIPADQRANFGEGTPTGIENPRYTIDQYGVETVGICAKITPPDDASWLRTVLHLDADDGQGLLPVAEYPYTGTVPAPQYVVLWHPTPDGARTWKVTVQSVSTTFVYGPIDPTDSNTTLTLSISGVVGVGYPTITDITEQDLEGDSSWVWLTIYYVAPTTGSFVGFTLFWRVQGESSWGDPDIGFRAHEGGADGESGSVTLLVHKPATNETWEILASPHTKWFGHVPMVAPDERNVDTVVMEAPGAPKADGITDAAIVNAESYRTTEGNARWHGKATWTNDDDDGNWFRSFVTVQVVNASGDPSSHPVFGTEREVGGGGAVPGATATVLMEHWDVHEAPYNYLRFRLYSESRTGVKTLQSTAWDSGTADHLDVEQPEPSGGIQATALDTTTLNESHLRLNGGKLEMAPGAVGSTELGEEAIVSPSQFGTNIRPVGRGSSLPVLPDTDYPNGAIYVLTSVTPHKSYISRGSYWEHIVDLSAATAFNTNEFEISGSAFTQKAVSADKVTIGSTLKVGGGGSKPGQLGVFDAVNNVIAWAGTSGGYYGIFGKQVYFGGADPSNSPFYIDSSGNVKLETRSGYSPSFEITVGSITVKINGSDYVLVANSSSSAKTWLSGSSVVVQDSIYAYYGTEVFRDGIYAKGYGYQNAFALRNQQGASYPPTGRLDLMLNGVTKVLAHASPGYLDVADSYRVGGVSVINSGGAFIGSGINTPTYGHGAAGFNPYISGVQYYGQTQDVTISGVTLHFKGGSFIGAV